MFLSSLQGGWLHRRVVRVFDVVYLMAAAFDYDCYYIEPGLLIYTICVYVVRCRVYNCSLFWDVDGFGGVDCIICGSALDLHEDYTKVTFCNDVDFGASRSPVTVANMIALPDEVSGSKFFALRPQ